MRMTTKLYTCFVNLYKQKSISSTEKTPLQYPNLDRFPSLQGHIYRPVALCASIGGKLIARSTLNRLRRGWKCTMLTHITSHCLPIGKIAHLPYVQFCRLVFSTKGKCLSRWTAILHAAFFVIERVDCRTLVEFCYPRQGCRSLLCRSSAVAEVGCSLLSSSHGHHQSCRRFYAQGRECLLYCARSFVSGDISAGICA